MDIVIGTNFDLRVWIILQIDKRVGAECYISDLKKTGMK